MTDEQHHRQCPMHMDFEHSRQGTEARIQEPKCICKDLEAIEERAAQRGTATVPLTPIRYISLR